MYTKQEIAACLLESSRSFINCIDDMSDERFFSPAGKSEWSPAQHVDHLIRSSGAVDKALSYPRFILKIFGAPNRAGKTYDELKKRYREKLGAGGKASGRYIPASASKIDRNKARAKYQKISERLMLKASSIDEPELDHYLLPHPLLGKLTLREMLFFTIYHTYHHMDIINNSRGEV